MAMKPAVADIIGKTIAHVHVKSGATSPKSQVFLVFTDGTHYELFSCTDDISGGGRVDHGGLETVRRYMPKRKIVFEG